MHNDGGDRHPGWKWRSGCCRRGGRRTVRWWRGSSTGKEGVQDKLVPTAGAWRRRWGSGSSGTATGSGGCGGGGSLKCRGLQRLCMQRQRRAGAAAPTRRWSGRHRHLGLYGRHHHPIVLITVFAGAGSSRRHSAGALCLAAAAAAVGSRALVGPGVPSAGWRAAVVIHRRCRCFTTATSITLAAAAAVAVVVTLAVVATLPTITTCVTNLAGLTGNVSAAITLDATASLCFCAATGLRAATTRIRSYRHGVQQRGAARCCCQQLRQQLRRHRDQVARV